MSSDHSATYDGGSPRRLAAILSADIKDSARLIGIDEEGTLARMKRYRREVIEPTIAEHHGRVIKNTGDGFLAIFDSPLEAVRCGIVIQQSLLGRNAALPKQQWLRYRIGVNLGDVIIDPDDIYGDGVNIAARVQALAQPGTVYISGGVYEQVKNKLVCGYQSLGDEKLKNITDPVRIYRVLPDPDAVGQAKRRQRIHAAIAATVLVVAGVVGWYAMRPSSRTQAEVPPATAPPPVQQQTAVRIPPSEAPRTVERSTPASPQAERQLSPPRAPSVATAPAAPTPQAPATVAPAPVPSLQPPLPATPPPVAATPEPSLQRSSPATTATAPAPSTAAPVVVPAPEASLPSTREPGPQTPPLAVAPAPSPATPPPSARQPVPPVAAAPPISPPASPPATMVQPSPVPPPVATPSQPAPQVAIIKPPAAPPQPASPYEPFRDCERCPQMISLPGGSLAIGSNDDPTEKPIHQVSVRPFSLGRLPVTIGEWKQCVAAKACAYDADGEDDQPIHNVSWNDAQQYVRWLSAVTNKPYRLPTEVEWEYAARAGSNTRYWWGNQLIRGMANCKDCGDAYDPHAPMKVASFAPNPFGLHDMTGGVAQWVADCWHKDYHGAPKDGSSWEAANCRERVLRGGSWRNDASYSRAASRNRYDPNVRYLAHGFRIARSGSD